MFGGGQSTHTCVRECAYVCASACLGCQWPGLWVAGMLANPGRQGQNWGLSPERQLVLETQDTCKDGPVIRLPV